MSIIRHNRRQYCDKILALIFFSKMLEQMSAELAQLSALYSAKCLENSQLDEKMSLLLADKENQTSSKYDHHSQKSRNGSA